MQTTHGLPLAPVMLIMANLSCLVTSFTSAGLLVVKSWPHFAGQCDDAGWQGMFLFDCTMARCRTRMIFMHILIKKGPLRPARFY